MYVYLTFSFTLKLRISSMSALRESISTGGVGLAWDGACICALIGVSSTGMGGGGGGGGGAGGADVGGAGGCKAHMFDNVHLAAILHLVLTAAAGGQTVDAGGGGGAVLIGGGLVGGGGGARAAPGAVVGRGGALAGGGGGADLWLPFCDCKDVRK